MLFRSLAGVNPDLLKIIERSPLGAALGRERMYFDLHKALEAWQPSGSLAPIGEQIRGPAA